MRKNIISSGFVCRHCLHRNNSTPIGTSQRNHCERCLYSLHLDKALPGDRLSLCKELMKPIGLYAKDIKDKYSSKLKIGEIKILHQCSVCHHISSNRIAGNDDDIAILQLLKYGPNKIKGHHVLDANSYDLVLSQLQGKIV